MKSLLHKIAQGLAVLATGLLPSAALAGNTSTAPKHVFLLDMSYLDAQVNQGYGNNRQVLSLIEPIDRYEPGGGKQGTITAKPAVNYQFLVSQLLFGVTDNLTVAVAAPLVLQTDIDPKLGWIPGVYQPQLGREYSQDDFWQWAKSMGQKKPGRWTGNKNTLADLVVGGRWRLPQPESLKQLGIQTALALQIAFPTGASPDPEELVAAGTTVWDLHNYGDVEGHFAAERPFLDSNGVQRFNIGFDLGYSWLRTRTFDTPTGVKNPLLLTFAPYAGKTYDLNPGDFVHVTGLIEFAPLLGPTFATFVSKGRLDVAQKFPPLLNLQASYTWTYVDQSDWTSQSKVWDWDREKLWRPGDKNTVRLQADMSFLRLGLPLQLYAAYRNQEWIHGKNTRASNVTIAGARLILKFW